jgi:hypothetical protein
MIVVQSVAMTAHPACNLRFMLAKTFAVGVIAEKRRVNNKSDACAAEPQIPNQKKKHNSSQTINR